MPQLLTPAVDRLRELFTGPTALWRARSFLAAAASMLVGAVLWINDGAGKPEPAIESASLATADGHEPAVPQPAPFPFRVGASYAGGFLFGWALRRFLKATAWIAGSLIAAIALLKTTGWVDVDLAAWQHNVSANFAWLESQASGIKQFLLGFLPSAGAAGAGLFFGFRRS